MSKENPDSDPRTTEEPYQRECANCAQVLSEGDFCPICGQRKWFGRLTFKGMARQVVTDSLSLNRGFLHTIVDLSRRPGAAARDFLAGCTVPYTSPTRYFLICLAIAQLVAFWTQFIQGFAEGLAGGTGDSFPSATEGSRLIREYFVLISAGALPIIVIVTRAFFARSRFNLAEHTVFHLYTGGHSALIFAILALVVQPLPDAAGIAFVGLALITMLSYYIWSAVAFFSVSKIRAASGIAFSLLLGMATFSIFLLLLMSSSGTAG